MDNGNHRRLRGEERPAVRLEGMDGFQRSRKNQDTPGKENRTERAGGDEEADLSGAKGVPGNHVR